MSAAPMTADIARIVVERFPGNIWHPTRTSGKSSAAVVENLIF
jgi:hypothetical protein